MCSGHSQCRGPNVDRSIFVPTRSIGLVRTPRRSGRGSFGLPGLKVAARFTDGEVHIGADLFDSKVQDVND